MISFRESVKPSDLECVRRITASTGKFHDFEIDVAVELVSERLAKGADSGYEFLFAERSGAVLGYTCYGEIPCTKGSYDLYWIAVEHSCQGQGVGKELCRELEQRIQKHNGRRIYIETSGRSDYHETRGFYLACGYRQEATLKDFYAPSDDKIIYCKALE